MHLNLALAQELVGLATFHNRTWCYPSQDTLCERLQKRHGQKISRRTLNRHLAALVAAGWIKRVVRHREDKLVGWVFRSTLYVLQKPVWQMVKRLTRAVAHAARWTRVPNMAHNVTPTGLKSSPGLVTSPPANDKKDTAARWASEVRNLLAR